MRKFFVDLIMRIIGFFVSRPKKNKVEDGPGAGALEDRLKKKVKKDGWKNA